MILFKQSLRNLTIFFEVEVVLSSSFPIQLRRFIIFFNDNDKIVVINKCLSRYTEYANSTGLLVLDLY